MKKYFDTTEIDNITLIEIENDKNGNPQVIAPFVAFLTEIEYNNLDQFGPTNGLKKEVTERAKKAGYKEFKNKLLCGWYVTQKRPEGVTKNASIIKKVLAEVKAGQHTNKIRIILNCFPGLANIRKMTMQQYIENLAEDPSNPEQQQKAKNCLHTLKQNNLI